MLSQLSLYLFQGKSLFGSRFERPLIRYCAELGCVSVTTKSTTGSKPSQSSSQCVPRPMKMLKLGISHGTGVWLTLTNCKPKRSRLLVKSDKRSRFLQISYEPFTAAADLSHGSMRSSIRWKINQMRRNRPFTKGARRRPANLAPPILVMIRLNPFMHQLAARAHRPQWATRSTRRVDAYSIHHLQRQFIAKHDVQLCRKHIVVSL